MSFKLQLEKSTEALKLNLEKKGVKTFPEAEIAFVLDVSGSFDGEHRQGVTQKLLNRLVPFAMLLDPDHKLDCFAFSDGKNHASYVGELTPDTCEGYIREEIIDRVPGYNGGTDYGHVIQKTLEHFGWSPVKEGLLARIFGSGTKISEKKRSIVLFVTDGDSQDEAECYKILKESEARKDGVYFLFIGVGGGQFPFLKKVADDFSNTGLVKISNLSKFVAMSDDELNNELIGDELVKWLQK